MFVVVVFQEARPGCSAQLRAALMEKARTTIASEPGCRRFDVAQDPIEGAAFLIYEVFDDEAAYRAHVESRHYADFAVQTEPWTATRRLLTYEMISDAGRA